jgi:hypothetical protein
MKVSSCVENDSYLEVLEEGTDLVFRFVGTWDGKPVEFTCNRSKNGGVEWGKVFRCPNDAYLSWSLETSKNGAMFTGRHPYGGLFSLGKRVPVGEVILNSEQCAEIVKYCQSLCS